MPSYKVLDLRTREVLKDRLEAASYADAIQWAERRFVDHRVTVSLLDSYVPLEAEPQQTQSSAAEANRCVSLNRAEVRKLADTAMAKLPGGPSLLEQRLWEFAEASPQGNKLITANLAEDPYLLRVYLTPERRKLAKTLENLGITSPVALRVMTMARPYLHHFFRGDKDREVHNHPWKYAVSLILTSGYKEYRWDHHLRRFDIKMLTPGSLNFIRRNDYHRVELYADKGCWTLFTSIGRVMASNGRDWNFLNTETGLVTPWGQWVQG